MANISISQLETAPEVSISDLVEVAVPDENSESGYASRKESLAQIADFMANDVLYDDLETTAQSLVGSINECFQSVSDGKALVAAAITDKGVQTAATDSFAAMAANIGQISGGGAQDRAVTFSADAAAVIQAKIKAIFYKGKSRSITATLNGTTAAYTSTLSADETGEDTLEIPLDAAAGVNTLVLSSPDNSVYFTQCIIREESDLPALTGSTTVIDGESYTVSSSSNIDTTRVGWLPFDRTGNRGGYHCWHPVSGAPQWLKLELPSRQRVLSFHMENRFSDDFCPRDVVFQGSNDDSNWVDLERFVFSTTQAANQDATIIPGTTGLYKYYRWYEETVNSYGVIAVLDVTFGTVYASEAW